MFEGTDSAPADGSSRERFTENEKLLLLQGQIVRLKRELLQQQEEIKIFTEELKQGKEQLERQLKSQMELFKKNSERTLDAERFSQITRGLHVSTTIEERFGEVDATYKFQKGGNLLYKINNDLILVNGPDLGLDVLSTKDLKVVKSLATDGEVAFCALKVNQFLYVGCNRGLIFTYNVEKDFERAGPVQLSPNKISQMRTVIEDTEDAVGTKHVLCAQDGGEIALLTVEEVPSIEKKATHNSLGIIYKMDKLPPEEKDQSYKFAVASTNGVAVLKVKKKGHAITLDSTVYLKGKVIKGKKRYIIWKTALLFCFAFNTYTFTESSVGK